MSPELTVDQAREYVELYKQAGVEIKPENVKSNKKVLLYVSNLLLELGRPHVVTEDDVANNEDMKDLSVGEIVCVLDEEDEEMPEEEKEETTPPPPAPSETKKQKSTEKEKVEVPEAKKQLYFMGKPVVSVTNRIISGKIHKDVALSEASYTLTTEEYALQVTEQ